MAEGILEIDDASFDAEVLKSEKPVLVDFWAPWCGPCKAPAPRMDKVADQFSGKVKFFKVNIDEAPQLAEKYRIQVR